MRLAPRTKDTSGCIPPIITLTPDLYKPIDAAFRAELSAIYRKVKGKTPLQCVASSDWPQVPTRTRVYRIWTLNTCQVGYWMEGPQSESQAPLFMCSLATGYEDLQAEKEERVRARQGKKRRAATPAPTPPVAGRADHSR